MTTPRFSRESSNNQPGQSSMNPSNFMPQVPFGAPAFMPQYFPTSAFMPFQMNHPYSSLMYPSISQSNMIHSTVQNLGSVSSQEKACRSDGKSSANLDSSTAPAKPSEMSASAFAPSDKTEAFIQPSKKVLASKDLNSHVSDRIVEREKGTLKHYSSSGDENDDKVVKRFKSGSITSHKDTQGMESADIEVLDDPKSEANQSPDMRLLIGSVEQVFNWWRSKKTICSANVMIQLVGVFSKILKSDGHQHLLLIRGMKPDSPSMQVIFYSIDRDIPYLLPNQTIVCTGHLKGSRKMQAYDFEKLSPSSFAKLHRIIQFCNKIVQDMP